MSEIYQNLLDRLEGWKTYLCVFLMILLAVVFKAGLLPITQTDFVSLESLLLALALAAQRHGSKTDNKKSLEKVKNELKVEMKKQNEEIKSVVCT